jgi:heme exporter protein C
MTIRWFYYAAPQTFYGLAGRSWPWLAALATVLAAVGLWIGFAVAPADAQQGEGYRIIFVHVPVSWMSMIIYLAMAFWSILGLTFNTRLSGMMTRALAPTGAMFAFLSLWTGALWGKPMWGTWWVWDARVTSVLVLFLFYIGYMALQAAIDDETRAARASGILALVGLINLPIIKFSVDWWNTLHQPASVFRKGGPSLPPEYLWPLGVMAFAYMALFGALWLVRIRAEVWRKRAQSLALQAAG